METNIVGRNLGITDRFREYATEKAEKVAGLAEKALALEIKLSRHREKNGATGNDRVELTLIGKGPIVRAEADGSDKYAAFDVALGRLLERVRRAKDRQKLHRGGAHRPISLHDAASVDFSVVDIKPADAEVLERVRTGAIPVVNAETPAAEEPDDVYNPVVIRRKVFAAAPMTVDDALYFMELVGHDFYLFQDAVTKRPSVVYRRKGWDYGVIELDENADEAGEVVPPARERSN
ncbi:ribosome-associated translation inhibitor RaiA [Cryobacterium sp. TMT2-18-3]|uniref:ribosome hibernation-promoting factor, HPF/YfiA family n=1 Tax=unclassified Cryobacterium TaxID=2649013 RepID=UPI00106D6846|nr:MULTISPECIES: ribosome-associated translation inhibitor RaiA [unclassified Cryobacterium]TFC29840.1 ribosome-associated translation inhibitor RaiA [Cryobacterium sp. TMT2-18-2]TFC35795.1 ribosome-associated translation inhibitor RaiA [Cryobacterium sp. TMT2-42-4]TFC61979.1 ribosome-associated translation inhibitor RaiA [Cryobacterium sp. TMT2-18-3]